MWTILAIVVIVLGGAALAWRLLVIPRSAPGENDRSRQHEVPGAHEPPPGADRPARPSDPPD